MVNEERLSGRKRRRDEVKEPQAGVDTVESQDSSSTPALKKSQKPAPIGSKDYLIRENIGSPEILQRGATPFPYSSDKLRVIRSDLKKLLPRYSVYVVKGFILSEAIKNTPKKQPAESKPTAHEELNEPSLEVIEGDNIIIMDDSGTK